MRRTRILVYMSLFIAIEIILTRFFAIQTPIVRIGFGFIPIALSAIMFGPVIGGITAMLADIIGMMLFPKGVYFPGFTFSALMSGVVYGLFLYKRPLSIIRTAIAVVIITVFIDLGLNTLWLCMMTNKAALAIIFPRLIKSLMLFPVQVFLIYFVWKFMAVYIRREYVQDSSI